MLLKIAWRNIWRQRRRSVIVIISVAIGIVATLLTETLSRGMMLQMLENQIGSHVAHIQVHRKGFEANQVVQNYLPARTKVERLVSEIPEAEYYSERTITFGLISSARSSSGVTIVGIDPRREERVTTIEKSLVAGQYLSARRNEVIVGKKLAEKLGVGVGDKIVAMATALDGHIGSDVFRIVGLYETFSSEFDKVYIYVPLKESQEMLALDGDVSEVAIILRDRNRLDQVQQALERGLGGSYEVLTYPEILPFLVLQLDLFQESMLVFYAIIGIALIFGIINTMLMSVFERMTEFGVLKAIGMRNGRLVVMILLEALFLGVIGSVGGFVVGYFIYLPLSHSGVNLSMFSASLNSFGVGAIIYPVLTVDGVLNALLIIPLIAVLGAIYPALKAARFEPVAAMRYV
jgi:ABC-type lipoprotein release transport system permease subunit